MKSGTMVAVVLTTLALWVVATPAPAAPAGRCGVGADCATLINDLSTATQSVAISGQNAEKNRTGLLAKLADAQAKLAQGKTADAVQKLGDYMQKVNQLAASGAMSGTDASTLLQGAQAAIDCLSAD